MLSCTMIFIKKKQFEMDQNNLIVLNDLLLSSETKPTGI
jgi:hypothetical protein